ncbi:19083_t:CDS:2, partial [Racocetra fulgida]
GSKWLWKGKDESSETDLFHGGKEEKDKLVASSGKSLTYPLDSSVHLGPPMQNDPEIYEKSKVTARTSVPQLDS